MMRRSTFQQAVLDVDEVDALRAIGWSPDVEASTCPDSSLLLAADEGVLDTAIADDVRQHVASCPACTMLAADLATVFAEGEIAGAGERIAARVTASRPPARRLVWGLASGGLLIAASVAGLVVNLERAVMPSVTPVVAEAGEMSAKAPTVFYIDAPATASGDVELTLRGESPARAGADRVSDLPGRPAADEDDWRQAVTLVQSGEVESAKRILTSLCARSTWRGALACAGLIELDRGRRD